MDLRHRLIIEQPAIARDKPAGRDDDPGIIEETRKEIRNVRTCNRPEILLNVGSEQEAREQVSQLPFAKGGVLSFTYAELLEL